MGATEVYTADSRCPFSSNAGPGNGMALTYDTHRANARKNLFPRRPVVYRRDIEILMSNVIKMPSPGIGGGGRGRKEEDRAPNLASACIWQAGASPQNGFASDRCRNETRKVRYAGNAQIHHDCDNDTVILRISRTHKRPTLKSTRTSFHSLYFPLSL
jgi:hypothetical protein